MLKDIEYYELEIGSKKYWDDFAHEFKELDIENKLINLAHYLKLGGNIHYIVSQYKRGRRVDVRKAVKNAATIYLEYLAKDDYFPFHVFSESQLLTILSRELKNRLYESYNLRSGSFEPKIRQGNLEPDWDLTEDKETLFFDNPWLDLVEEIVDENYCLPLEKNIHIEDQKYIDEYNGLAKYEHKYQLGVLPDPFLGNVLDAKVVILSLNPRYDMENELIRYSLLSEEEKVSFVTGQCDSMSLKGTELIPDMFYRLNICDFYWYNRCRELLDSFKEANSKIGLIQYIGYSSIQFKALSRKLTREIYHLEDDILYTQKFAVRLVNYLMQQNRVIIITHREKLWFNAVKGLKEYDNLIILDNFKDTAITPDNCIKSGKWHLVEKALTE